MKTDYEFDSLHIPLIARVFPETKKEITKLFQEQAPRWVNESEMIRGMIHHCLQCKYFLEVKQ